MVYEKNMLIAYEAKYANILNTCSRKYTTTIVLTHTQNKEVPKAVQKHFREMSKWTN